MRFAKILFFSWVLICGVAPVHGRASETYQCGGLVEQASWRIWDQEARKLLQNQLLGRRLIEAGDSYALYDIQVYFQNLEAMAERCVRTGRLIEFADDLLIAYSGLERLDNGLGGLAWACKGGTTCPKNDRTIAKEVPLVSAQGLGLMSALAAALANSPDANARSHPFVVKTMEVSIQHLLRWGTLSSRERWQNLINAKSADVKDESSSLLFSDQELWQIAIYANLAKIYASPIGARAGFEKLRSPELGKSVKLLLKLFKSRTSIGVVSSDRLGQVQAAEIDRGFWRLYKDGRYAGYTGSAEPMTCSHLDKTRRPESMPSIKTGPMVSDIGWDFSHARRLVHVFTALQGSRSPMQRAYGLRIGDIPEIDRAKEFAAQLVVRIWNGDKDAPLFANYWSGANGWYRVGYDNGSNACMSGYPPFGLSDAFASGGYAAWAKYYPVIDEIAHSIYSLTEKSSGLNSEYLKNYFTGFTSKVSDGSRMTNQLMFWPSMVR